MPKRNYGFEKRQKELEKLKKRELKAQRKLERAAQPEDALPEDDATAPLDAPPEA